MNRKTFSGSSQSKTNQSSALTSSSSRSRRWFRGDWGHRWVSIWAVTAAILTAVDGNSVQRFERQIQTLFFELRGAVTPPEQVVILTIDDSSLAQGEFFRADPQRYADLAPLQAWPWQRTAYAIAIDKLMQAGAKSVGIDVIYSTPSSYGEADDLRFAQVLQKYSSRVVLAAQYTESQTAQGSITQLSSPLLQFCSQANCSAFINFPIESDGRIHQQGSQFLTQLLQRSPALQAAVLPTLPSLAQATLTAAQVTDLPVGSEIFFYGPPQTFKQIPFWMVLDQNAWQTTLQSGAFFKDKIVLIGATAASLQDFHAAPFSKSWLYRQPMPGVEIHANAIATLLQNRSMTVAVPQAPLRGLFVLIGLSGIGWLLSRPVFPLRRARRAVGFAVVWAGISYLLFWQGRLIVPTAVPLGAIVLSGFSQLVAGTVKDQEKRQRLRDTLKQYVTSPIVQEIISQDDDLQDLLRERELELAGKILGGRYRIQRVLGAGGFSETYVAEDLQRPGQPQCVVKQLKVNSENPNTLQLAKRLFVTEAETLERLGRHEQIPQLLAHFEENQEFYLIQEFVQGHPLGQELPVGRGLSESKVIQLLSDLLTVLGFVHQEGVIHRDLKPSNIMRRYADSKLVLIDFGIAKKISTQIAVSDRAEKYTVAVGTPGYMPSEQSAGRPQFNSDLYALGMIGIEAITGFPPRSLDYNTDTGAVLWKKQAANVNPTLGAILTKLVHQDFRQRYQTVQEVQADLALLELSAEANFDEMRSMADAILKSKHPVEPGGAEEINDATINWPDDWSN